MISKAKQKALRRYRRHNRVRGRVFGTALRPRLAVYRSNKHLFAQAIDDERGVTLVASSDMTLEASGKPAERAEAIGKDVAKKIKDQGIEHVVFDCGGFDYSGNIKILADAARAEGLTF